MAPERPAQPASGASLNSHHSGGHSYGAALGLHPATAAEAVPLAAAALLDAEASAPMSRPDVALITLMRSTGGWWCASDFVVLSERPTARYGTVSRGRASTQVVRYSDACWVRTDDGSILDPTTAALFEAAEALDPRAVQGLGASSPLRPALLDRFGRDRYVAAVASSAELVASEPSRDIARLALDSLGTERFVAEAGHVVDSDLDRDGQMRRLWRADRVADEEVVMIEVVNSTPDLDGSRRHHFLRVPPTMRTCAGAVAWTFGMEVAGYAPTAES